MKSKRSLLATPYVIWMALFTVIPILMMVVYAFTQEIVVDAETGEKAVRFTLNNFAQMGTYTVVFLRSFKLALVSTARRLGITAKPRKLRSSERVTLRDPDAIERMLILMGAPHSAREWTGKRSDGEARGKANRLANFDDANMRRSAKAAAEACDKVRQAFEILGDDIPDNLKSAGQLRLDHADASLEQLGRLADPPITKDAIAGRIRRLLQLAEKTEKARRQSA